MVDVAGRTDLLFKTITNEDGKEYSCREIAERAGDVFSSTTVWKVRTGQIKNPTLKVLAGICKAFGVSINYYTDEGVTQDSITAYQTQYRYEQSPTDERLQDLILATKLRQSNVADIALQVSELDEDAKQDILGMIQYVRMAQQVETSRRSGQGKDESVE